MSSQKSSKEVRFCIQKLSFKEKGDEFYSEGFIATSHPDKAASEDGRFVGDVIPKPTLQKIVDKINSTDSPISKMASYRHDWIREENPDLKPAGKAVKAELRQTDDGQWGAWVSTHHSSHVYIVFPAIKSP